MLTTLVILKLMTKLAAYSGLVLSHSGDLMPEHHRHRLILACYLGLLLSLLLELGSGPGPVLSPQPAPAMTSSADPVEVIR